MISARKIIRITVRKFWGACAFLLISLAVFVVIGRELSPQLNRYKTELSEYLSEQLSVDVRIQTMRVDWSGMSPQLSLRGVDLINPAGKTLLSMDNALLRLNLLRSVANRNLAFDRLEASAVTMELSQNNEGIWGFEGVPWRSTAGDNFDIDDPLDIFLLIRRVDLLDVQMQLNFRDGDKEQLNFPELSFANNGNFHRLNSSIVVGNQREAVSMILEFRGDPRALDNFSAKGYTRFEQVDVERVLTALPGAWQSEQGLWKGSELTAESWFDIFAGGEMLFRGRLDVTGGDDDPADNPDEIKVPRSVGGNFTGRLTGAGELLFSLRDTVIDWPGFQAPVVDLQVASALANGDSAIPALSFRTANLDITHWLDTLAQSGLLRGRALEAVETLQPQGQLQNITVDFSTNNNRQVQYELRANFTQFQIDSWRGTPAADNLNGFLRMTGQGLDAVQGEVKVDSREQVALQFPTLYDQPMQFDAVNGQVNWQASARENLLRVTSGLLSIHSDSGDAKGYFDLYVPLGGPREEEQLILQLGMNNTPVKDYQTYVPSRLPKDLLDWLQQSLGEKGIITTSGFLYRGGLVPEMRDRAEFQLYADIKNADLHYHPDWPSLKQASGQLWLDRFRVYGDIETGKFLNGDVNRLSFDLDSDPKLSQRLLRIDGEVSGDADDAIALLQSDVFLPVIDRKLDTWSAKGQIKTDVQLAIPLQSGAGSARQSVAVHLNNVDLAMTGINIDIDAIQGTVHYDNQRSLYAENLQGVFLGNEVIADIYDDREADELHITATGSTTVDTLNGWTGFNLPAFVQGGANFNADVVIADNRTNVSLRSDLVGVQVDLPAPYGKAESQARDLQVQIPLGEEATDVRLNYDRTLFGILQVANNRLRRGVISTVDDPQLPRANQLLLTGKIATLDFDIWRDAYRQNFAQGSGEGNPIGGLPLALALRIDQFLIGELGIEDIALNATVRDSVADIRLESEKIAGNITVNDALAQPLVFNLDRLRLPKVERKPPSWSDIFFPPARPGDALNELDPSTLPPFDFSVTELFWGEESLGSWSFSARPVPNGMATTNLNARFPEGEVVGLQADSGTRLSWLNTAEGMETRIEGRFRSDDLAAVMEKFDQPPILQSEDAQFDFSLRWPDTPTAISMSELRGEVALDLEQGSYYSGGDLAASGAVFQLISVLNFDTWMRRLRLDFSDLGRGGLAYDSLQGLLRFDAGQVYLDQPLVMLTQSGEIQLTGAIDLDQNELDMKFTATLPMGGNLTFLTALAAGLPAAAGVWVVSKIFDEQIDKVSTLSYAITGPLDNPKSEFLRLFDSKAEATAASAN